MNTQNITPLVGPVCLANMVQDVPEDAREGGAVSYSGASLRWLAGSRQVLPLV